MTVEPIVAARSPEALPAAAITARALVRGKFIYAGAEKLYIRGVTYGTFRPDENGNEFSDAAVVEADFARMAEAGINAVRTYTVPPRWLLDLARDHGLRVMVGLPWEQHVAFLEDNGRTCAIEDSVRAGVRTCAGHPAVLCYAIGNEIPSSVVRWHGARPVETFLRRLYTAAKEEDPEALVTYVNFPSTEYLKLDFADLYCFNVYLESRDSLKAYLARLQNLAGDRPLLMAEVGLDSRRNGLEGQARTLDWQIRTVFEAGASGVFVFAWTDEWYRGGADIEDWRFGLTDRARRPKPALGAVREAFDDSPFPRNISWPRISVVVCSHNGARTLADCCEGLSRIDYPSFECILVDDGSEDETPLIGRRYGLRVISTENRGLSSARNEGLRAASGDIVAYIDDDARPDPHWLRYIALAFMASDHVGMGGPNIAPPGDGPIADAVAHAPGGPVHVLLTDELAEHIPGCNMAFRKSALEAIGGFDPIFRAAGDDVDMCWRLQDRGWTIGFSSAAMVWHHRRNSVKTYWKQQKGYGKAEALLERKWPERYNSVGHVAWSGRLYGKGLTRPLPWSKGRIYAGTWGAAPFQSLYEPSPGTLRTLPLMPEWYLVVLALLAFSALGAVWHPLLIGLPLLVLALGAPIVQAFVSAWSVRSAKRGHSRQERSLFLGLTAILHLIQPLARLWGRVRLGLTVWRWRGPLRFVTPRPRKYAVWRESWLPPDTWLVRIEARLQEARTAVVRGREFDRWDLEARGGILGATRVLMAIEEHGGGKQLARFRFLPRISIAGSVFALVLVLLAAAAGIERVWVACVVCAAAGMVLLMRILFECSVSSALILSTLSELGDGTK